MSDKEKYELIKALRSQLSSYEQMLIYFNSLSILGEPLVTSNYLKKYKIIKNIPLPLVDFTGDIHLKYKPEDFVFEWDEITSRVKKL